MFHVFNYNFLTLLSFVLCIQVGKYYCVVDNPTADDYEYDVEPGVMERVKEKAKVTRKGLGHRRSHSDFNSRSHQVLTLFKNASSLI